MIPIESIPGCSRGEPGPENAAAGLPQHDPIDAARQKIGDLLARLEENRRLVMALHYHEELELPVIATALGIPLADVRRIHSETLHALELELAPILGPRRTRRTGRR